jgi:hypothetical protein
VKERPDQMGPEAIRREGEEGARAS